MIASWEVLRGQQDEISRKSVHETSTTTEIQASPTTPTNNSLPLGIQKLIFSHKLRDPTIQYLNLVFSWLSRNPHPPPSITELAHEILHRPGLNTTECLLIAGLQAYSNYVGQEYRERSSTPTEDIVTILIPSLSSVNTKNSDVDTDVFAWSVLMIGATTDKGSDAQRWARRVLQGMPMSEGRGRELGTLFVPLPVTPLELLLP